MYKYIYICTQHTYLCLSCLTLLCLNIYIYMRVFGRWDFIEDGTKTYKDMDRLVAYAKALNTWAKWVDTNVDPSTTKVFFQGVSPDHNK